MRDVAARAAGASGSWSNDLSPEQLTATIRLIQVGAALLAPTIARRPVERFADRVPDTVGMYRRAGSRLSWTGITRYA